MHKNRDFYIDALEYMGQNNLSEYLLEFYFELLKIHLDTIYAQLGYKLAVDELYLMARMEAHAYVGIIMDWVKAGMNDDYMNYFEQLHRINRLEKSRYSMFFDAKTPGGK